MTEDRVPTLRTAAENVVKWWDAAPPTFPEGEHVGPAIEGLRVALEAMTEDRVPKWEPNDDDAARIVAVVSHMGLTADKKRREQIAIADRLRYTLEQLELRLTDAEQPAPPLNVERLRQILGKHGWYIASVLDASWVESSEWGPALLGSAPSRSEP